VAVADLWAGAEVQLKALLSKLALNPALSLSVVLFNGGRLQEEIEKLGIPVTVFPENRWGNARIFRELVYRFKQEDIQIVHTHKHKDTILAAPAAKFCGIPRVVRTVHGLPEPFQGIKAVRMNFYESMERIVHRRCVDAVIAVSGQIEDKFKADRDVRRVTCIRNGIDLEEKSIQVDRRHILKVLGIDLTTHVIGTVGRLTPVKGLPYLLMAGKTLLERGMAVKVLIVGDGGIRTDLEKQARDMEISTNVVFLGHREDTDQLLQAMDIFVLPSMSEGVPMALLEAMAASRPIVASRVGGIPEVVKNGVEGLLVEPKDVKGLAESFLQIIQYPDMARKMGEAARKRVEREFSATGMAEQVGSLYHELMESKGNSAIS